MRKRALSFIIATFVSFPLLARTNDLTLPVLGHLALPSVTYTSEISITNNRGVDQLVRVDWLGRDGAGSRENAAMRTIPAKMTTFDRGGLIFEILGINNYGMGAVRFVAVDAKGNVDPDADLDATAYIVAYRPGGSSSRQEIEAVPSSDYHADRQTLYAIRDDEFTRTNIGLVNLDKTQTRHFTIDAYPATERMEVDVPPMSMRQLPLAVGEHRSGVSFLSVTPDALALSSGGWVTYASSVDSTTGDAWTARRVPLGYRFNP